MRLIRFKRRPIQVFKVSPSGIKYFAITCYVTAAVNIACYTFKDLN